MAWPHVGCTLACASGGRGVPWQAPAVVFLVGQASKAAVGWGVQQEGQELGDVLLGSYMDMYCNLTLKVTHGL